MATLVAGIGPGLFILAFFWVLSLLLCVTFSNARGGLAYLGTASVVVIILVTVILWFVPREDGSTEKDHVIYDWNGLGRTILLAFMGLFVLIGLVLVLVFHIFETQRAEPLKKIIN